MKNAMKKLLSLVLVAMLLVSVVPMGAMAAETDYRVTVQVKFDEGDGYTTKLEAFTTPIKESSTTVGDLLKYCDTISNNIPEGFEFSHAWKTGMGSNHGGRDTVVNDGETIEILFVKTGLVEPNPDPKPEPQPEPETEPTRYYVNIVVKLDGKEKESFKAEINGETTTVGGLIDYKIGMDLSNYDFTQAWVVGSGDTYLGRNGVVKAGDTVHIGFTKKSAPTEKPTEPTDDEAKPITVVVKVDKSDNVVATPTKVPANGKSSKVEDLLTYVWNADWNNVYEFSHAWVVGSGDTRLGLNGTVKAGQEVHIMLKHSDDSSSGSGSSGTGKYWTVYFNDADNNVIHSVKVKDGSKIGTWDAEEARDEVKNDKKGYTFEGWRLNGAGNILSTNTIAHTTVKNSLSYYPVYSKNGSDSDKLNSNKVYLHIFLDNRVTNPAKDINITDGIAKDGVVTLGEAKDVVKKYYSAKNDDGIIYDGLYLATGSWVGEFVKDNKDDRFDNIDDLKKDGYVHINIMVNNAKAKTNSNADSSNPKTGDDIYMTVTVMGLSAAALCAVYYISKKRAVR